MSRKLKRLSDHHHAAIRMKVEGLPASEIAQRMDTSVQQVYLWFSDPMVKEEIERVRGRIFDLFAERMVDITMRAFHQLEKLADLEVEDSTVSVEQKLEILREILDRNPMTQKPVPERAGASLSHAPPPNVSDAELIQQFRAAVGELPPGVIEGHVSNNGNG